jgi:hypothetical protein
MLKLLLSAAALFALTEAAAATVGRPHIVLIVADDLGE